MAYTDKATVKTYCDISSTDDDDLIDDLIDYAQKAIETYCSRVFEASSDTTRKFDAVRDVDGVTLWLDEDLAAITTVTNGDSVVVSSSEYTTEPRNTTPYYALRLLASSNKYWTYDDDPENAISILGKWAYSTSAPNDIVHATIRFTAWLYNQKDTGGDSTDQPLISPDGTLVMPAAFPRDVLRLITPYKKVIR